MATNGEISESTEQTKSIRFTVSRVDTEEVDTKQGRRPSGLYDLQEGTIGRSSLGYTTLNTQEAYPNTLYYRDQDSSQVLGYYACQNGYTVAKKETDTIYKKFRYLCRF